MFFTAGLIAIWGSGFELSAAHAVPDASILSWETHLAGAAIGVALAFAFAGRDVPPRKRYSWEDEADAEETPAEPVPGAGERPAG